MYRQVLEDEIPSRIVDIIDISGAIAEIKSTYRRISLHNELPEIDYDDEEYRYAYIYLYSVCHTEVVKQCAREVASVSLAHFENMMKYDQGDFRVCSLGGGPGCDVFGLLMARLERGEFGTVRFCVVDLYRGWETTLHHAIASFCRIYSKPVEGYFLEADLSDDLLQQRSVVNEIQNCDILNLVKFVSVLSNHYHRFPEKLQIIFSLMKPGAYVFFLDNSSGGFYEMVSQAANQVHLQQAISPTTNRRTLQENYLKTGRFADTPLPSMSVCFALWVKPFHPA